MYARPLLSPAPNSLQDAASIAALLDQLKESPEWQQIAAPTPPTVTPEQPSVASLLAQLQTPVAPRALTDVRHHTFQQALPALTELAADPAVADVLESVRVCVSTCKSLTPD